MTERVVNKLAGEFEKRHVAVDCFRIEAASACDIDLSAYDLLGMAYPVHAFNAPEIAVDFAKRLPESGSIGTFVIHTAGEESKVNFAASDLLIKILGKKGYNVFYNRLVEMPSNFIIKHDAARVGRLFSRANEGIPRIAQDIVALEPHSMQRGLVVRVLAALGRAEWPGARILGKFFYARSSCTRCGTCEDNCPNRNIAMGGKAVAFKWRCGLCMRCVYRCPSSSISIRRPFRFLIFDEWYDFQAEGGL